MAINKMLPLEEAREVVLSHVSSLSAERTLILDAVGRVCAEDVISDLDVAPFAHSAMDGFALVASEIESASENAPVEMKVLSEVAAGDVFEGELGRGECIRIMTGAELPECTDTVVKYEVVKVISGDGKPGSVVAFTEPSPVGKNIREAGEEARRGEVVVSKGEIIGEAGVGFLASCGALEVDVYRRPRVAIMATGSELVPPDQIPGPGHIRESNSYAIAACVRAAGGIPDMLAIVEDTYDALESAVKAACVDHDFVITTGGAANGDFDFIKKVVENAGELYMTLVNMRPGKAQTFGIVDDTPVFGLPGNPAAAYCGFQMLVRPALRKMQGYTHFDFPKVEAKMAVDSKKPDQRRFYMRSSLVRNSDGTYEVTPATNQSSGLFSTLQRSNCLAILPEGGQGRKAGDTVECVLLDVSEDTAL